MSRGALEAWRAYAVLDFVPARPRPGWGRLVLASAVALSGSLGAAAALVAAGEALFPSTRGFSHFRASDYLTLTVLGVLAACSAWPVAARLSSVPRRLFFALAFPVMFLLWLPDLGLLAAGTPPEGVAVLMAMHLAVALVTYNALVRLAPAGPRRPAAGRGAAGRGGPAGPGSQALAGGRGVRR